MPRLSGREQEERQTALDAVRHYRREIDAATDAMASAIATAARVGCRWTDLARASGYHRETLAQRFGHHRRRR